MKLLALFAAAAAAAFAPPSGRVLVLDDFEAPAAAARWEGPVEVVSEHASHGTHAARLRLDARNSQVSSVKLPSNWTGYDRLLFDVYSEREGVNNATVRVYDAVGGDVAKAARDEYFDARGKVALLKGWTHVEVKFPLKAATYLRDIALDRIVRLALSFEGARGATTVWVDNLRLVSGAEGSETASRSQPQDAVSIIDNRWVTLRQVVRPEDVPESPEVARLRKDAQAETQALKETIDAAKMQGIETIYQERHLVIADLGLHVRPLLAWFNNDEKKREMFSYVAETCRAARLELNDELNGASARKEIDDTQVGESSVPPMPPLKGRPIKGRFFLDDRGEPMMVLSVHSPSRVLQRFFASPRQHLESYTVGGGSRWSIDHSPVYAAWQKYPDTHRVGWDGWCGHLVRDLSSMGGSKKENTVICLESPRIHEAVSEYIKLNIPKFHDNPELLYDIMAYELMYICYCDRSRDGFHEWLLHKHGTISAANECWGTSYKDFKEVIPPPVKNSRPLPGTNRGLWYDWARYNQDRFTDYLLWVRNEIRKIDPHEALAAGGSSSMLAGRTGTTGIDEERIVNEVDDVIIHEGGGSTMGMDLQLALAENKKPLADPEMSLGGVQNLLPHFLHGKSVAQIYHWPTQPANEYYSNNRSSIAHSWSYPLPDVNELLRVALDVRRLNKEVAAFADAPAQVAILYSQTSTLQLPPEMLTWQTTPYLAELEKTYTASQYLDTRVTFVTERQALKGWLPRYKMLLVPAVRNLPAAVFARIKEYAAAGGRVLIVPESLLGDEYNRHQDYLAQLGLTVRQTRHPKPTGTGRMVQGYDQSFSQEVTLESGAAAKLLPAAGAEAGELESRGVQQEIAVTGNGQVLYRFAKGGPAIVRVPMGKGAIDYAACSLEDRGYSRLLDKLFAEAGVDRQVRVLAPANGPKYGVEARTATLGGRRLLYVTNYNAQPEQLRVEAPQLTGLTELRGGKTIHGTQINLPPRQTEIYELF